VIGPAPVPLTVPRGATTEAGANAYDMKFPSSPTFINKNPAHLLPYQEFGRRAGRQINQRSPKPRLEVVALVPSWTRHSMLSR
jgi:hypothetical protein